MNSNIKRIMDQCGIGVLRTSEGLTSITPGCIITNDDQIEKFAKMIIDDCASICEMDSNSYKYSFTPAKAKIAESTAKYCGVYIKKHFDIN